MPLSTLDVVRIGAVAGIVFFVLTNMFQSTSSNVNLEDTSTLLWLSHDFAQGGGKLHNDGTGAESHSQAWAIR